VPSAVRPPSGAVCAPYDGGAWGARRWPGRPC